MAAEEAVDAVHRAAAQGDVDVVAGMLDEDPGLLLSEWMGYTLLTTAVWNGHVDLVRLLRDRGVEINQANSDGDTALHVAACRGHEEMVSILITSGTDLSRKGFGGRTVLMSASSGGHVAVVWLLLRSLGGRDLLGRVLDERDAGGRTALYYACFQDNRDVLRALLLAGADHTIADNDDTTLLQFAKERNYHECVGVIQWWEGELQRAYVLHKARTLYEDTATRQQAPAAPVPAYLSPRVAPGSVLPSVQVKTRQQGGQDQREEEMCAMVGFVVKDLAAELYIELLAGFHQ